MGGFAHNTGEGSFHLIMKKGGAIQYGKFQQDTLVVEIKMVIFVQKLFQRKLKKIK